MSVVVRMEMPKEGCHTCDARCVSDLYGYICGIERKNVMPFLGKKNRPDWCPIICQLPEGHGRLVDADAFEKDVSDALAYGLKEIPNEEGKQIFHVLMQEVLDNVKKRETIVPAERSEKDGR